MSVQLAKHTQIIKPKATATQKSIGDRDGVETLGPPLTQFSSGQTKPAWRGLILGCNTCQIEQKNVWFSWSCHDGQRGLRRGYVSGAHLADMVLSGERWGRGLKCSDLGFLIIQVKQMNNKKPPRRGKTSRQKTGAQSNMKLT